MVLAAALLVHKATVTHDDGARWASAPDAPPRLSTRPIVTPGARIRCCRSCRSGTAASEGGLVPTDTLAPSDGASILEGEVRELVRRRGIDPARDRASLERLVAEALTDYTERAALGVVPALPDPHAAARSIVDALAGLGRCSATSTPRSRRSGSTGRI